MPGTSDNGPALACPATLTLLCCLESLITGWSKKPHVTERHKELVVEAQPVLQVCKDSCKMAPFVTPLWCIRAVHTVHSKA